MTDKERTMILARIKEERLKKNHSAIRGDLYALGFLNGLQKASRIVDGTIDDEETYQASGTSASVYVVIRETLQDTFIDPDSSVGDPALPYREILGIFFSEKMAESLKTEAKNAITEYDPEMRLFVEEWEVQSGNFN